MAGNNDLVTRVCACGRRIDKKPGRGRWPKKCATCRDTVVRSSTDRADAYFDALRDLVRSS